MSGQETEFMKQAVQKIVELTRENKIQWRESYLRTFKTTVGDFAVEFNCISSGGVDLKISAAEFRRDQSEEGPDGLSAHLLLKELVEAETAKTK